MSAHLAPREVQLPALVPLARGPLAVTLCGTYHPGATSAEPAFTKAPRYLRVRPIAKGG